MIASGKIFNAEPLIVGSKVAINLKEPFLIYFPFGNKIFSFELILKIGINSSKIVIEVCSKFSTIIISLLDASLSIANKNLDFSSINSNLSFELSGIFLQNKIIDSC